MKAMISRVRDLNRTERLGWNAEQVRTAAALLQRKGFLGNEPSFKKTVLAMQMGTPSTSVKRVAGESCCPRCQTNRLAIVTITTAGCKLPYCQTCGIVLVPKAA